MIGKMSYKPLIIALSEGCIHLGLPSTAFHLLLRNNLLKGQWLLDLEWLSIKAIFDSFTQYRCVLSINRK
jgi:hypothetical protein